MEGAIQYLEGRLKLKVNRDKSKIVNLAFNNGEFKFLGFGMGKTRGVLRIMVHAKTKKRFKDKLRKITSRKRSGKFKDICSELKRVVIGWLNYYAIADVKTWVKSTNKWLRRRLRMLFWKRWKLPKTRKRKLIHLGTPEKYAYQAAYSRRGYWFVVKTGAVTRALSNEKLVSWGYVDILKAYEFKHSKPVQLCFVF